MKQKGSYIIIFRRLALTSILFLLGVIAAGQPVAKFAATPISACIPMLVNFTDLSTGNPAQWKWDLGNGTISYLKNPSVTYFSPGLYTIKLVVQNSAGADSVIKTNYITANAAPVVNFTSLVVSGCNPLVVNFNDVSTAGSGTIAAWQWDFGDGSLSGEQSPSHTYTVPGNYNVTLKVTNSNGCVNTLLKANYINVNGVGAGFSFDIPASCTTSNIHFQNTSAGNGLLNSQWSFGDGSHSAVTSPTHTYVNGGHFTVKLFVRNNFGCTDSFAKNIRLDTILNAVFTASATVSCKAPFEVNFTNQVLSGNTYLWDFGDSTISSQSNPTHIFADTGSFTVKLILSNSNGCIDSVKKTGYIKINKPNLFLSNLPDSGCMPLVKIFYMDNSSSDRIVNYLWNFGDGATSLSAAPAHTYRTGGYFNVSLITTSAGGCRDTMVIPQAIKVNTKPTANFTAGNRNTCAKNAVVFTNLSTGGATSWEWHFGDGSISFDENPSHGYKDTGYMTVTLIAMNGGCADTVQFINYIYIKPAIAKFTRLYYNCSQPYSITFRDFSKGADEWLWDFGDSTYSAERNPMHTYPSMGVKNVSLTVVNHLTGCDDKFGASIRVLSLHPDFYASDTIACRRSSITFTSTLHIAEVRRFSWDFGDGETISFRNNIVSHTYQKAGSYDVKLIIMNDANGCIDSITKHSYIRIDGPTAKFSPVGYTAVVNSQIVFLDSSVSDGIHPIQSWKWDYGDSVTEIRNTAPFNHSYNSTGLFFVKLQLTDSKGCTDSLVLERPLVISGTEARFISEDSVSCPNKIIHFTNQSAGRNLTYLWSFGDGLFSTNQDPVHIYSNAGNYDVKLVATDQYGFSDSVLKRAYISVHYPVATFSMSDSVRNCPPLIIQFTDASSNAESRRWDFGDGNSSVLLNPSHFYTYPGIYFIKLTATSPGGCTSEMIKQITVKGPRGVLTYNPLNTCRLPFQANFIAHTSDAVSYVWDFNDGNTISNTDTSITHTFTNDGNYVPKLILVDSIGCRIPITGIDTIHSTSVSAKFNFTDSVYCTTGSVLFNNLSTPNDLQGSYFWSFGDGTFSTDKSPVHVYNAAGNYHTSLKVRTRFGCEDSITATAPVRIGDAIHAAIFTSANSGCTPLLVTLKGLLPAADTSSVNWQWSFGNGNTSDLQNPPLQNYSVPGLYNIAVTATNASGCVNTISKTIEVFGTAAVNAGGDTTICKGSAVSLQAMGAVNYAWAPPEGLSCTNCVSPIATPLADTKYFVNAVTANGCSAIDSILIKVKQPIKINYNATEKLCAGQSKRLVAAGATTYRWWPAIGLSNAVIANPLASPDSTTIYRVIGTDGAGCFKDTGFVTVQVFQQPTVNAGQDKTTGAGSPIDLAPVFSSDVTEVNWSPTSGIFRNSNSIITVRPAQTTEYTVEVKNSGGCTATDKVTVSVLCDGSNIFIPNTFSPNNDGANDIFYPRGKGLFKIKTLKIFSRWGETVFEKTNFNANDVSAGWDGTFKGKRLNTDVYIYFIEIICSNNTILNFNGNVALVQ